MCDFQSTDPKFPKYPVPQALTDTELQLQADNGPQPQADTDPQPQADTDPQPQAYNDPQTKAYTDPQPQADTGSQMHSDTDPRPQADTSPQPQADSDPQPPSDTGPQPPLETGPQPPSDTGPQPPLETGTQPPSDTGPQPPLDTGPQPPSDTGHQPPLDTGPQHPSDTGPQPPSDTGPQPPSDTGPQPPSDTGPQPPSDTGPQSPSDTGPQPPSDTGPQPQVDTGHQPPLETGPQSPSDTGPQPPSDTGPQPPSDTGPQPQVDTGPQPPSDTGPQPPSDTGPQPPLETGPQPPSDTGPQPLSDTGPQPQVYTDPQSPSDTGPQPPSDTSPQPQVDTGPQPPSDTGPQPPSDTGPQPPSDTGPQPPLETGPQPPSDTGPQPLSDTGPQPQVYTDPQSPSDTGPQPPSDTSPQPQVDTGPQPPSDTGPQPLSDTGPQPPSDTGPQPPLETGPQPPSDTGPQPLSDTGPQPQVYTDPQSPSDTGPQPPSDTSPQPQVDTGPQPPSDTGPQPLSDTGPQPPSDIGPQSPSDTDPQPPSDTGPQPPSDTGPQPPSDTGPQPPSDTCPQPQVDTGHQPPSDTGPQPPSDSDPQSQVNTGPQPPSDTGPQHPSDTDPQSQVNTGPHPPSDTDPQSQVNTGPRSPTESSRILRFDAALLFAEEDYELADEIQTKMNDIVMEDGQKAKVCLYDHPQFGAVIPDKASEVKGRCNITFVLLTKNIKSDQKCCYISKEAIMGARLGQEDHVVFPLHTKPKSERDYVIPEGLVSSEHYDWFEPLPKCEKKIRVLFDHYRKPAHLRSGHGSNVKYYQQSGFPSVAKETQPSERPQALTFAIERSIRHLEKWKEEVFYPTFATKEAVNTLRFKGSVFLVGKSGDGKTSSAYHIITEFISENKSFQPLIISHPEEIKLLSQDEPLVVLADNIFGTTNFTPALLESWKVFFLFLEKYVQNGSVFFIATSQSHIEDDCHEHMAGLSLLRNMIDTTSEEYRLKTHEKDSMFQEYLHRYKVKMARHERKQFTKYDLEIGFPQCCKLYFTNPDAWELGPTFFQKPYLQWVVSDLKKREKLAYMVLVMVVFEEGKLTVEKLNPFSEQLSFLGPLKQACAIQQNISISEIRDQANILCKMGYLQFNFDQQFYEFSHQSVYDVVGFIFGKDYVLEILKLCPLQFLLNHTILSTRLDDRKQSNKHAVLIPECHTSSLLKRIVLELDSCNIRIFEHSGFCSTAFVEKAFEDGEFKKCLERLFSNPNSQEQLESSNLMYVLSAYLKYGCFLLKLVSFLKALKPDGFKKVLHDILEGACSSGNESLFNSVINEKINPCKQCILRASECNLDVVGIMEKLISTSVGNKTVKLVLENLVKRGRLKTLKNFSQHLGWKLLKVSRRKQRLYSHVCSFGSFEMIKFLLQTIGKPDRQDELLKETVTGDSEEILQYLLSEENKNAVDRHGRTLLHYACLKNSPLWKHLHDQGVDPGKVDKFGATALHLACETGSEEFVRTLISNDFHVTVTDIAANDQRGSTRLSPLHSAAKNDQGWTLVKLLIENGPEDMKDAAMVNFTDGDGSTPLHICSEIPDAGKMIKTLVKYKCNTETKNKAGRTALHIAARANIPSNIQCLLDSKANVNSADNNLKTPLHYAVSQTPTSKDDLDAQSNSIGIMLSQEADLYLQDADGNTAIHVAAINNISSSIFERLLKKAEHVQHVNYISVLKYLLGPKASITSISKLLKYHPEVLETKHSDGESFLQVALATGSPFDVVRILMGRKQSAMSVNWGCISFRDAITRYNFEETVEFLHSFEDCFSSDVKSYLMHFFCEKKFSDEQWTKLIDILMKTPFFLSATDKDGLTVLHKTTHSPSRIKYLLNHKADIDAQDNCGETALHVATRQGYIEGVKCLLRNGADQSIKNKMLETPLLLALKRSQEENKPFTYRLYTVYEFCSLKLNSHLSFTQLLIEQTQKGIMVSVLCEDVHKSIPAYLQTVSFDEAIVLELLTDSEVAHVSDASGNTVLHYAVCRNDLFAKLLSAGADINSSNNEEQTCLHLACKWKNNSEMIQYLLDQRLSPCAVDSKGYTPLMYALASGLDDVRLIKSLLEHFSRANKIYFNILHLSVECAPKKVIEHVLQVTHMFIWKTDNNGRLPIHCAIARGDATIVMVIIKALKRNEKGETNLSTIMHKYEDGGNSLLHVAATVDNVKILKILLREGFDVNTRNNEANTPLHIATEHGNMNNMKHLLKAGAEPDVSNNEGLAPLHVASRMGAKDLIHILLTGTNRASVNKCSSKHKRSALHFASGKDFSMELMSFLNKLRSKIGIFRKFGKQLHDIAGGASCVVMLIDKGLAVNQKDSLGKTPLHLSAENNNTVITSVLLRNGCDIDAVDNAGKTPLYTALEFKSYEVASVLIKENADSNILSSFEDTAVDVLRKHYETSPSTERDQLQKLANLLNIPV